MEQLKQEMDAWIKSLRQEIKIAGDELDDALDEQRKQKEEIQFNYENITQLQERLDKIELTMERLVSLVENLTMRKTVHLKPLKHLS